MAGKLVMVGGGKPQLQRRSGRTWSAARGREFLRVLGETCNVSEACRRSGVATTVAYRRRAMDASFRAGWLAAVGTAYGRLELALLERAFKGTEKVIRRRDGSEERMWEYPDRMAMQLLKLHRNTALEAEAEFKMSQEELDGLRQRLIRKLQRLKKRNEEQEARSSQLRDDAQRNGPAGEGGSGYPGTPDQRAVG